MDRFWRLCASFSVLPILCCRPCNSCRECSFDQELTPTDMLDTQEVTMRLTYVSASSQMTWGHKRAQVVVGGGWGQTLPRREARETRAGNLETGKAPGGPRVPGCEQMHSDSWTKCPEQWELRKPFSCWTTRLSPHCVCFDCLCIQAYQHVLRDRLPSVLENVALHNTHISHSQSQQYLASNHFYPSLLHNEEALEWEIAYMHVFSLSFQFLWACHSVAILLTWNTSEVWKFTYKFEFKDTHTHIHSHTDIYFDATWPLNASQPLRLVFS